MIIEKNIQALKSEISNIRRTIHQNPERGFNEYETSKFIISKLKEYGIDEIHTVAKTGIVGFLKGTVGDKTTAFRADIDGLPVQEENNLSFKSQKEGVMHACGHDGHTAALLGFVKYAVSNRNKINDDLIFIFQPAEEGPGGAEVMVSEGVIEKYHIDRIIGMHIFPEYQQNKIACKSGPLMARNGEIQIKIKGQKAHGAMPHKGVDAMVAAANLVLALQSIMSRNLDPMDSAVLTLGKIQGGDAVNIIAEEIKIGGTMRAFSDSVYETMVQRINEIAQGIERSYNCKVDVEFNHMYRVVDNNEYLVEALKRAVGKESYIEAGPVMISEDFSFFQQKVPGVFFFLGSYNENMGYTYPLHSSRFDFDEEILIAAVQTYANLLNEI